MAQWVRALAAERDDPSSIPRHHREVKRENGLPKESCSLTSTQAACALRCGVLTLPGFDALKGGMCSNLSESLWGSLGDRLTVQCGSQVGLCGL